MNEKVHPQWEAIQKLYKTTFGTNPEVIDFIAVKDILRLCCYGLSPEAISIELLVSESYVITVLEEYYEFSGWEDGIEIDLYSIYRSSETFDGFESYLINFAPGNVETKDMKKAYVMCETYEKLKELLEDYE